MRFLRAATLSLLASVSLGALGAEPVEDSTTQWLCIDTGQLALRCQVQRAAGAPSLGLPPADRLPPIVRSIREQPASWRARAVLIPLFNHPIELAHVRELAQAVLCGRQSACYARLAAPGADDPTDWLAFADAHDPLFAHPALDQDTP